MTAPPGPDRDARIRGCLFGGAVGDALGAPVEFDSSGDSDSTGAITGNVLGTIHGYDAIARKWIAQLELRDVIERLCEEWSAVLLSSDPLDDD